MEPDHAITLVLARSCLAALSNGSSTAAAGLKYDQVLLALDAAHGDDVPGLETDALTADRGVLFDVGFSTIEDLVDHGVDHLQVELVLAMLAAACDVGTT